MKFDVDDFRNVLLYISNNLELRHNGSVRPLQARKFNEEDPLLSGIPAEEMYFYVDQLLQAKLIKVERTAGVSPRSYGITGITPQGREFLSACTRSKKYQAAKNFALSAASSAIGGTIAHIITGGML
ncbi:MAG: DUF2513 domain-containing protein [Solobacterium sp.]|nr:DUF2513 domain-containing protein [Solobacterium sp.]